MRDSPPTVPTLPPTISILDIIPPRLPGASVTPTATATAAGAPTTKKKATKNIDNILQDFSDGDSSFVSDPSAVMSNVSGVGVPPLAPS